ncbi:MAG: cysteine synthase [Chlamydiae bacterium]|nr:cysteine synthase [Chlamydiota bacterium]MBI3277512.1 cysteine synthase [Chlamydiota bacterium]
MKNRMDSKTILDLIGNTPLIRLQRLGAQFPSIQIDIKAEWFNPGGSVKDRPALRMILEGEKSGKLNPDKVVLDSSSGNTAIAYAMIAAFRGYQVELVMPENVSEERRKILAAYRANVIYSDPLEGSDGAIREAHRRFKKNPSKYFMPDQYNNAFNPKAHEETTAQEIWEQTSGQVTHLVAGIGTGGTVMGTGRGLKAHNSKIQVIAVEPADALHGLEGMKHMASSIVPGIYNEKFLDQKISIETEDAYEMTRALAREEGILVGQSSGAVLCGILKVAGQLKEGLIVGVFPDGGDKYLTTRVWE